MRSTSYDLPAFAAKISSRRSDALPTEIEDRARLLVELYVPIGEIEEILPNFAVLSA